MLERDGVLWTWRLPALPATGEPLDAERIGDHRLLYLDYEGPVSGGRGSVQRIDGGDLTWLEADAGRFAVDLAGAVYHGRLEGLRNADGSWRIAYLGGG